MSLVKSPYFPAIICVIIIAIVMYMLFRDVGSMKGTMTDLVTQHNNAQKALETHENAIKRLQDAGPIEMDYDIDEDEEVFGELPTIQEVEEPEVKVPEASSSKKKKGV